MATPRVTWSMVKEAFPCGVPSRVSTSSVPGSICSGTMVKCWMAGARVGAGAARPSGWLSWVVVARLPCRKVARTTGALGSVSVRRIV